MPDKIKPKDLETMLTRLRKEWQELADLLTSQDSSQERVIEVEKILFRDASGQCRGKISSNPDGSADLILSDRAGNARVRLGVNRDGEAFFELKDQKGEDSFKVAAGFPSLGAEPGPAAAGAEGPNSAVSQQLASPDESPQPIAPAGAGSEPRVESGLPPAPSTPDQDEPPGQDASSAVFGRMEKLGRQYRRLKWFGVILLGMFGVILATQAVVLFRAYSPGSAEEGFVVRDLKGNIRATLQGTGDKVALDLRDAQGHRRATLGLGNEGAPGLTFYDRDQRVRAELTLGPDGEPKFTLRDQRGKETQREAKTPDDSAPQRAAGKTDLGSEVGTLPGPTAGPAEAVSPPRKAEDEGEFVGFKRSNKYHYPTCKWARTKYPNQLIKFKSAEDAQKHHYIPCPVCKPPPLSR